MGIDSVIKRIVRKMRRDDSANARTLKVLGSRAIKIDADLNQANDTERQHALHTTLTAIAQELDLVCGGEPANIPETIRPLVQLERERIVFCGDEALDEFQAPPRGHPEEMVNAAKQDKRELFAQIKGLEKADDGLLRDVIRPMGIPARPTTARPEPASSRSGAICRLGAGEVSSEVQAHTIIHEELMNKFRAMLERGGYEPAIVIHMSDMGRNDAKVTTEFVPLNHTFADLSSIILSGDLRLHLPDFWLKMKCGTKNCVTNSGVWWEWQHPKIRVADVVTEQRAGEVDTGVWIKMVAKMGEYVVVLVKKDEMECEMPIDVPRVDRNLTLYHFQHLIFPTDYVAKVLELKNGSDASHLVFDANSFSHRTNPLFIEVLSEYGERVERDKGKGPADGKKSVPGNHPTPTMKGQSEVENQ